jgi:hypothetical protein
MDPTTAPTPVTTAAPTLAPAPTTPTTPTVATTAQVAAHQSFVQTAIADLEKAPQTVENAERYLDLKAESAIAWVQQKHVRTRIIEAVLVALAIGFLIGAACAKLF